MIYKSCYSLNRGISFNDSRIVYCTLGNTSKNKEYPVLVDNYNGEPIDWDNLLDQIELEKKRRMHGGGYVLRLAKTV